jgi:hypothetical protein
VLKILFTYPEALPHETLLLQNLMQDEWDFLHVSKPDYSKDELINFLELIPNYHHKVVLHSHFELIQEFDLAGININAKAIANLSYQEELTSACDMRELCLKDGQLYVRGERPDLVSYSANRFGEIQQLPFQTDYVFLSPIFDSISKLDYHSALDDHEVLTAFLKTADRRVIALGGINNDRIEFCKQLGFDGYAMRDNILCKYFTFVETIQ